MAGFHHPGDPYFPNQGNGGWIEDDPEEDEEPIEVGDDSGTDSEPEVIDPPPIQPPVFVRNFQGPTPVWGSHLHHWSQQQNLRPPYGMCRDFYDVRGGGSADRALPVMVGKLANQSYQSGVQASRLRDINVEVQVHTSDIRRLDKMQDNAQFQTEAFQAQMIAALAELREQQAAFDRRLMESKQSDEESSSKHNLRRK